MVGMNVKKKGKGNEQLRDGESDKKEREEATKERRKEGKEKRRHPLLVAPRSRLIVLCGHTLSPRLQPSVYDGRVMATVVVSRRVHSLIPLSCLIQLSTLQANKQTNERLT